MNRIDQTFGTSRVLLPVIHPIGRSEAFESIRVVVAAGVGGVFLIDQGMAEDGVLSLVQEIRAQFPTLWIGVNLLSRRPADALEVALNACGGRVDGIWSDNAHLDEGALAEAFVAKRCQLRWTGLYFGGVAFKYQPAVDPADLGRVTARARAYMDVVCTSGPGTGRAASLDKVRAMSASLGGAAFALASGITVTNVHEYLPYVHAFLVGTGIESRVGVVDDNKLRLLLRAMHEGAPRREGR